MTKYEPKTDDVDRVGLLQWMEQSPQCSRYSKDSIKYILHDLTHAEACLKERDAEIERLNKLVDWHINHCEKNGGECIECSIQHCPRKEPLHFHHDGCPSCTLEEADHAN